jgi:hypothetical protein
MFFRSKIVIQKVIYLKIEKITIQIQKYQDSIQNYLLIKKLGKSMMIIIEQLTKFGIQDTTQDFLKTHFNLKF